MTKKGLARAEKTDSATVVAQVSEIAALMSKGQWVLGVTEHAVAQRWGVLLHCVRTRAAEARRLVQNAYGDTEGLRAEIILQFQDIASYREGPQDRRTAVAALMGIAAVTGLVISHRVDQREPTARQLTPEARRAEIAKLRAQLDEADRELAREESQTVDMSHVPDEGSGT